MKVMRDETFGPVVGVMKVRDAEEALRLANDSRYGLSGSVFGERERAERVARRVECGAVNVNDVLVNYAAMDVPMGGWKQSGIGYRHGEPGIKKYCRTESVVITRFGGKSEPTWYPYTKARRRVDQPRRPGLQRSRPEAAPRNSRLIWVHQPHNATAPGARGGYRHPAHSAAPLGAR